MPPCPLLLLLLFATSAAAAASSIDAARSSAECNVTGVVAAGSTRAICTVHLRDSVGAPAGGEAELCRLTSASNFTDSATGATAVHDPAGEQCSIAHVASPFSFSGHAGTYSMALAPVTAGRYAIAVQLITDGGGLHELGRVEVTVAPGPEDLAKLRSACSYNETQGTACTAEHVDSFGNVIMRCRQMWPLGGGAHEECSPVLHTYTN